MNKMNEIKQRNESLKRNNQMEITEIKENMKL